MRRVSPEGTDDHGCCDAIKKRIYINSADQIDEQWSSFSHEKYHAALKEAWLQEAIGLDLRHYEEAIVRLLERGLYPALRACGYGD